MTEDAQNRRKERTSQRTHTHTRVHKRTRWKIQIAAYTIKQGLQVCCGIIYTPGLLSVYGSHGCKSGCREICWVQGKSPLGSVYGLLVLFMLTSGGGWVACKYSK